ncbi:hypothetical protein M426DRAFT_7031 [Hypoxylon sp. CI-4A]|nr:hypothetical protein M426DRAFT_7031 [Hypoxylon sp. CI-4A]
MVFKLTTAGAVAFLLAAQFINGAMAAAYENLAILDAAALFSEPNQAFDPGLGPRYFAKGMPPVPAAPAGKAKRQQPFQCPAGKHSCLEVGPQGADFCCDNDEYCFLNATWNLQCCGIGTTCGSPCPESLLFCNNTVTSTTTTATSGTTEVVQLISTAAACCGRACSTSYFLCQTTFGGQCCEYGASCGVDGQCLFPASTSMSTLVTPIPSGCTTSQFSCPTGGGCCNLGSICTSTVDAAQSTSLGCVANLTVVDTGGLSEGARVGIGVGVAVGAAIVIGAITWFWIHRRRAEKSRREGETMTGSMRDEQERAREDNMSPFIPYAATSDITSPSSGVRPRLHENGLVYGYYGPDAVDGPYTDSITAHGTEFRASPESSNRAATTVTDRYPNRPGDIVRPVELDTQLERAELGEKDYVANEKPVQVVQGPFELDNSPPMSPHLMDQEEAEAHRALGVSPSPDPSQQGKDEHK